MFPNEYQLHVSIVIEQCVSTIMDLCCLFFVVARIYAVDLWSMQKIYGLFIAKANFLSKVIFSFFPCASTSVFFDIMNLILLIEIFCDITF